MLNRSYFSMKIRYLILGIVIGAAIMSSALVFANTPISAWVANNIGLYFNNQFTELPQGYDVILYNGRAYTPARFVAEELGAEVIWDEVTSSIFIQYEEEQEEEETPEIPDDESEEEKTEEPSKPISSYRKLPYGQISHEAYITVTGVDIQNNQTTLYLEIEGRRDVPIQLKQGASKLIVGDESYKTDDLKSAIDVIDTRWYHDIREEDRVSGWIKFPAIDKETEYLSLYIETFRNDGSNETTEFEFDIAL